MMDARQPLIELLGVSKTYGRANTEVHAIRGVDVRIFPGELTAILGPSGSGKSTFMNILGWMDAPTVGKQLFRGVEVGSASQDQRAELRRRYVGFVFQRFDLLAHATAFENVELPLTYRGVGSHERKARVARSLREVGLEGREDHRPAELSGGQQQRVAIARALVGDPVLLLADEPTGQLDSARRDEIMRMLVAINRQRGVTVLIVTHDAEVGAFASRTLVFRDGRIASDTRRDRES
jgi:putative ABC transport system ATP-binding protein